MGRKRVALVDADGTWLAIAVVPANVQDRDCLSALTSGKQCWPSLREAVLDGAFTAERCETWCNHHGMRHRVVELAAVRREFWREQGFVTSRNASDLRKLRPVLRNAITYALCQAA